MRNRTSPTNAIISDFDVSRMPRIYRRTLHPWAVHRSATTQKYIATICRPDTSVSEKVSHLQFQFNTEREAKRFCKAYSPPKFQATTSPCTCMLCQGRMVVQRHCRNCGAAICERCSTRWGLRMIPKTFYSTPSALTVRVCKSCDWLSNAFCMALLQGRYQDAIQIFETGNVNLRTSFADIHREAMFPVHCAVMGGSIDLVRWLVEIQLCPLSVTRGPKGQLLSVQTSACRTLMDIAMAGKPKFEILRYLVRKGLSITDAKDTTLAPKTLEAMLKAGPGPMHQSELSNSAESVALIEEDVDMIDSFDESVTTTLEDACALCCEKAMDCVLYPCGHQCCCADCGTQIKNCPICKVECSVLRVFKT